MKLGHHKDTKVTETNFWQKILGGHKRGKKPPWGEFLIFLPISLHPVIEFFWNSIYVTSSTLSKTMRKLRAWGKSGSCCIVGVRLLFLRHIFGHFRCFSHYVSGDAVIWTTWTLDWMYYIYSYLKIEDDFF